MYHHGVAAEQADDGNCGGDTAGPCEGAPAASAADGGDRNDRGGSRGRSGDDRRSQRCGSCHGLTAGSLHLRLDGGENGSAQMLRRLNGLERNAQTRDDAAQLTQLRMRLRAAVQMLAHGGHLGRIKGAKDIARGEFADAVAGNGHV